MNMEQLSVDFLASADLDHEHDHLTALFLRSPALLGWHIEVRSTPSPLGPLAEPEFRRLVLLVLCFAAAFGFLEIGVTAYAAESGASALRRVMTRPA